MVKQVPIGAKGAAEERVQYEHTLTAHNHQLPPVYSTPDMIRLMETAGFYALTAILRTREISVGTSINVEHRLPSALTPWFAPPPRSKPSRPLL